MAIRIVIRRNRARPLVFCDHCGRQIARARDGNYQWRAPGGAVFFTHKECCHAFEEERGGFWGAFDLQAFPQFLANNLGVKREEVRELLSMVEMLR
jgi:hypothetical protein